MNPEQIYNFFKQQPGHETMAGLETIQTIESTVKDHEIKNVLELGSGIGTISYTVLENSNATLDLYEPEEFCINELTRNLQKFAGRYTLIDNYKTLPPKRNYDLVIVDGGAGERNNGSDFRTILAFLDWLQSVKTIYVQGYRYGQRAFIRKALADRYVYKLIKNPDGVTFKLKKSRSKIMRLLCALFWGALEKIEIRLRKKKSTKKQ